MWIVSRRAGSPETSVNKGGLRRSYAKSRLLLRSDPLPFMLLSAEKSLCRNVQFVDIDYEKLMVNKKTAIQRTKEITELLEDVEFLSDEKAIQIRSKNYLAIGCDLKALKKLDDILRNEILPADCSVLCLAEVSLTYMDVQSANAAIAWASKLSDGQEQTTS